MDGACAAAAARTFSVEQARDAELVLSDVEGVVEVADVVVRVEAVVVDEVGPVRVYERIEAETVAPARREVVDLPRHMRIPEGTTTHMRIPEGTTRHMRIRGRKTLASWVNKGRALHFKIFIDSLLTRALPQLYLPRQKLHDDHRAMCQVTYQ